MYSYLLIPFFPFFFTKIKRGMNMLFIPPKSILWRINILCNYSSNSWGKHLPPFSNEKPSCLPILIFKIPKAESDWLPCISEEPSRHVFSMSMLRFKLTTVALVLCSGLVSCWNVNLHSSVLEHCPTFSLIRFLNRKKTHDDFRLKKNSAM